MNELDLLSGPSDDHIFAGLLLLPKISPPPAPSLVFEKLETQGLLFVTRLIETYVRSVSTSQSSPPSAPSKPSPNPSPSPSPSPNPSDVENYPAIALNVLNFLCNSNSSSIAMALIPSIPSLCKFLSLPLSPSTTPAYTFLTKLLTTLVNSSPIFSPSNQSSLSNTFTESKLVNSLLLLKLDPTVIAIFQLSLPSPLTPVMLSPTDLLTILTNSSSTSLPQTFNLLLLHIHHQKSPCQKTAMLSNKKLMKKIRALLTVSMRSNEDVEDSENSLKNLGLCIIGNLFENFDPSWAIGEKNDTKELQVFVRVACGEIRILLASILSAVEGGKDWCSNLSRKLEVCAKIFLASVKNLIEILNDEDDESAANKTKAKAAWSAVSFETILHIKNSLDDSVDAMLQFMGDDSLAYSSSSSSSSAVILQCVKPIGAWYAENEFEEAIYQRTNVARAIKNAILTCHSVRVSQATPNPIDINITNATTTFQSVGDNNDPPDSDDEDEDEVSETIESLFLSDAHSPESLFFLLPALASLLATKNATNEFIVEAILEKKGDNEKGEEVVEGERAKLFWTVREQSLGTKKKDALGPSLNNPFAQKDAPVRTRHRVQF